MRRLVALYHQPRDPEHFKRHLVEVHLPLVRSMPGVTVDHWGFEVEAAVGDSPYFAIVEVSWESRAAMEAALASPAGERASADVPAYATGGVTILHYDEDDVA